MSFGCLKKRLSNSRVGKIISGLCFVCELFMKNQTLEATLVFFRSFRRIEVKAVKAGCWYIAALTGGINGLVAIIGMLALEVNVPGSAFSESDCQACWELVCLSGKLISIMLMMLVGLLRVETKKEVPERHEKVSQKAQRCSEIVGKPCQQGY